MIINLNLNKPELVDVPKTIIKFLWNLTPDFAKTVFIDNTEVKSNKINEIINKLISDNKLPDFLVNSKIKFEDGKFVIYNLLSNKVEIIDDNVLNKPLSQNRTSELLNRFPSVGEIIFSESKGDVDRSVVNLISQLKLSEKFPEDIFFLNGSFYSNLSSNSPKYDIVSTSCPDLFFDLGEFNLGNMSNHDEMLKLMLNSTDKDIKLINIIFYLNYLTLKGHFRKNKIPGAEDYAKNFLINCALITSYLAIEDLNDIMFNDFEYWNSFISNHLIEDSFIRKQ